MAGKQSGGEPTLRQSKSALLEAAQAAVEDQKVRTGAGPASARSARTGFRVLLVTVLVLAAAVLIARPSWFVGPDLPIEPEAIQTASARLALVDAIGRVRTYLTVSGQLPPTPDAAGVTNHAISLKPLAGGEFELTLRAGDSLIAVRSTDSLKPLVVDALRALQRRS